MANGKASASNPRAYSEPCDFLANPGDFVLRGRVARAVRIAAQDSGGIGAGRTQPCGQGIRLGEAAHAGEPCHDARVRRLFGCAGKVPRHMRRIVRHLRSDPPARKRSPTPQAGCLYLRNRRGFAARPSARANHALDGCLCLRDLWAGGGGLRRQSLQRGTANQP